MQRQLTIEEALQLPDALFIDVRSPAEYEKEHIAGAINIPLFDNEERKRIGILYKHISKGEAQKEGLKIASSKLPALVQEIEKASSGRKAVLYCWRGGMRSKSISHILDLLNIPSYHLLGGYKAYRRYIYQALQNYKLNQKLVVLHGLTGVGKTRLLQMLKDDGQPVLDLESLAGHRGSVFGHIGLPPQTSQKNFDALLYQELQMLSPYPYWILEGEGKKIGNIFLPPFLVKSMLEGYHLLLEAPLEIRVSRLVEEYTPLTEKDKKKAFEALATLANRLGQKRIDIMKNYLRENKLEQFIAELCCYYYDQLYHDSKKSKNLFHAVIDASCLDEAADKVKKFIKNNLQQ
ncbi:MAG: tRNA 2-selenouridine(34) synthase MnmH [Firmicutes bacterium]|jgi:tRNA 2-selenouridine synthase|nr:tRNA 2-selenouridine(34) synthase MnmH [Bacillota bacterium]